MSIEQINIGNKEVYRLIEDVEKSKYTQSLKRDWEKWIW